MLLKYHLTDFLIAIISHKHLLSFQSLSVVVVHQNGLKCRHFFYESLTSNTLPRLN